MSATDHEVAGIMDELSRLQTWCVMMSRKDSGGIPAADLIQRTRVLIVERLYGSPVPRGEFTEVPPSPSRLSSQGEGS